MEYCPDYPLLYCDCPFGDPECGNFNCADVIYITDDVMAALDTNGDGQINYGDDLNQDDVDMINEYCDLDGDMENTSSCEVYQCIIACENAWRDENCENVEHLFCHTPYECPVCPGAWGCEDIYNITVEVFAEFDTNGDG